MPSMKLKSLMPYIAHENTIIKKESNNVGKMAIYQLMHCSELATAQKYTVLSAWENILIHGKI